MPEHNHPVLIAHFDGTSRESLDVARERADEALRSWYAEQQLLFRTDGGSVFQFSTTAIYRPDTSVWIFTITVFYTPFIYDKAE